jgi:hypothetical protein
MKRIIKVLSIGMILLILQSCQSESSKKFDYVKEHIKNKKQLDSSRIHILESKTIFKSTVSSNSDVSVYIIRVDKKDFLVNSRGGIIKIYR